MPRRNPIPVLRTIALVEGASFLMLLFIAMPLKYFAGMPMAVKVAGWRTACCSWRWSLCSSGR